MQVTTQHLTPSQVLRCGMYRSTYDCAIAWIACHDPAVKHGSGELAQSISIILVADLYGVEPGQVVHDVMQAHRRERRHTV